ncbi:MAG TPA: UDP-N-acetylmuramate dehydrogenase [Bacillota bacterium]|nr:UDP-N-acetylmuramate dehydrogenase [Candidatus Fermentithermobacillaceae bacterium]HOB30192.1 UDP-N-acetylmuramate dehydrogenase [Bacillota bacterium]HOK64199.1 UDP-N-acetylmuramate dehydrogenase [Bacillota bacterium]HOL11708.1 UDP-N-acetylmuramate dehydrogenase [Bacillota bacterium]HOQ02836.1 UDP-N-acetylmuramate dehydrogenase [Bacillota bacterium]
MPSKRDSIYLEIAGDLKDSQVFFSEPMANHTSFKIGGPCDLLVIPKTGDDAMKAWSKCRNLNVPCYVVGNCTNLLVKDGGFRGCIIKLSPYLSSITRDNNMLIISSGTLLQEALEASVRFGLSGLEFSAGIPGSLGGAVTMNAGAFGSDIGSLVKRVEVYTLDDEKHWIPASTLDFSYRHSLFSDRKDLLILSVELVLTPGRVDEIQKTVRKYLRERRAKQPLDLPSAGSIFKRPQGRYVGEMIEMLGLKGFSCGDAMISPKHAGFIVNTGNATAEDVLTLMEIVKKRVYEEFGVMLEPEIVVIGED